MFLKILITNLAELTTTTNSSSTYLQYDYYYYTGTYQVVVLFELTTTDAVVQSPFCGVVSSQNVLR